jgi:hypothetical protein
MAWNAVMREREREREREKCREPVGNILWTGTKMMISRGRQTDRQTSTYPKMSFLFNVKEGT